jgi:hypothetical protein
MIAKELFYEKDARHLLVYENGVRFVSQGEWVLFSIEDGKLVRQPGYNECKAAIEE